MQRNWTSEDNYTAIGYLKLAMEHYNKSIKTEDGDSPYYGLPELTREQQQRLIGAMHRSFDNYTEQKAFDKA